MRESNQVERTLNSPSTRYSSLMAANIFAVLLSFEGREITDVIMSMLKVAASGMASGTDFELLPGSFFVPHPSVDFLGSNSLSPDFPLAEETRSLSSFVEDLDGPEGPGAPGTLLVSLLVSFFVVARSILRLVPFLDGVLIWPEEK